VKFKPLGKGLNVDSTDSFDEAGHRTEELLDEMASEGHNAGAVMGGALTALVFRLIISSPDSTTAIGMITSCMASGARAAVEYESEKEETAH
tara:strand:+ start:130 stop:405 length:276 start_codon:yes stop_codon:yes gene_type:complete